MYLVIFFYRIIVSYILHTENATTSDREKCKTCFSRILFVWLAFMIKTFKPFDSAEEKESSILMERVNTLFIHAKGMLDILHTHDN